MTDNKFAPVDLRCNEDIVWEEFDAATTRMMDCVAVLDRLIGRVERENEGENFDPDCYIVKVVPSKKKRFTRPPVVANNRFSKSDIRRYRPFR